MQQPLACSGIRTDGPVAGPPQFDAYGRPMTRCWIERAWKNCVRWLPFHWHQVGIRRMYRQYDPRAVLDALPHRPLISLVIPWQEYTRSDWRRCIRSIAAQYYDRYQLVLVGRDDGSTPELNGTAKLRLAEEMTLVKAKSRGGLSDLLNAGLEHVRGALVGFLHGRDWLTPDALLWLACAYDRAPHARWLYCDELRVPRGGNYAGFFQRKPDYSPEHLLAGPFTGNLTLWDTRLVKQVGGFREQYDGAAHYDLALRAAEQLLSGQIVHVPQPLYLSRVHTGAAGPETDNGTRDLSAARAAAAESLKRRKVPGCVGPLETKTSSWTIRLLPRTTPPVSILIPTRNGLSLVRRCIESLRASTSYPDYEIVVIDNQSDDPALGKYLKSEAAEHRLRVVRYDRPFNHSAMHNELVPQVTSPLLVLLNNDVYAFCSGWLEQLVATVQLAADVAGAGGKLFYPDGSVQHAGIAIGPESPANHVGCGLPRNSPGYWGRGNRLQQVAAVTAAMMIIRRDVFLRVQGFDAERYPLSYNDADLWMRIAAQGYRCLFNPAVTAIHDESKTRGVSLAEDEFRRRLQHDVRASGFEDRFWSAELFENLPAVKRSERTADWVRRKLAAMAEQPPAAGRQRRAG